MIARGGRLFVLLSGAASIALLPFVILASAGFACLTVFLVFVFRDPSRKPGPGIVAPADGTVREVDRDSGLVSVYLSLWNVHVTRAPVDLTVSKIFHQPGRHLPASNIKSPGNERVELTADTEFGEMVVTLISGIAARRIVPYVGAGQTLRKGDRLGLIRFGSRVDILLPRERVAIKVEVGQKLRAGVSCVAEVVDDGAR